MDLVRPHWTMHKQDYRKDSVWKRPLRKVRKVTKRADRKVQLKGVEKETELESSP